MKFRRINISRRRVKAAMDMTPMIDATFQLLIFFMLTSSFVMQPGLKVDLPESTSKQTLEEKNITVQVTKKYEIFVDNEKQATRLDELETVLKNKAKDLKDPRVMVAADGEVPVRVLVSVLDAATSAGIDKVGVLTQEKKT